MAFDYQTLKNLTNQSFSTQTIPGTDVASQTITSTQIASNTLYSGEFATGSVILQNSETFNTLQYNYGGTSQSSLSSPFSLLTSNSSNSNLTFAPTGINRMVVFTSSGTYTPSSGTRYVWVQVQGAGGGGSGHGESGAAGGYAEKVINVTGVGSISVTIGGGGGGTYYSNTGGDGSSSSFGPYVSAGGGYGANRQNQHNGGVSGGGSGGDLNLHGGSGGGHEQRSSGMGGTSYFGGSGPAGHPQGGHFAHNHQGHSAPGTGGTSGYFSGHRGADGRPGIIVITEFY